MRDDVIVYSERETMNEWKWRYNIKGRERAGRGGADQIAKRLHRLEGWRQ